MECPEGYVRVAAVTVEDEDDPVLPWLVHPGCVEQVELEPGQVVCNGISRLGLGIDCAVCEKPLDGQED